MCLNIATITSGSLMYNMTAIFFILITVICLLLFYAATNKNKFVTAIGIVWLFITGLLAYFNFFKNTTAVPPRFLIIPVVVIIGCIATIKKINYAALSKKYLLTIHALRLPVELVLYRLFIEKQIPVIMTFEGWNFDILMGITALLILGYSYFLNKYPADWFLLLWNICGLIFLTIIVVTAVLSVPFPFQQLAFNQPNIAVLQFPFIWLPAYVVPVVVLSHIFLIKCIMQKHKKSLH